MVRFIWAASDDDSLMLQGELWELIDLDSFLGSRKTICINIYFLVLVAGREEAER